jgi:hypothetical protein
MSGKKTKYSGKATVASDMEIGKKKKRHKNETAQVHRSTISIS